jgi:hypothetical protein
VAVYLGFFLQKYPIVNVAVGKLWKTNEFSLMLLYTKFMVRSRLQLARFRFSCFKFCFQFSECQQKATLILESSILCDFFCACLHFLSNQRICAQIVRSGYFCVFWVVFCNAWRFSSVYFNEASIIRVTATLLCTVHRLYAE